MGSFLHPGVYVLEIPSGARSIEGVPTGIAIFVGETEFGPTTPTRVRGRTDYGRLYGGYMRARTGTDPTRVLMAYAIDGFFANGGTSAYVLRAVDGANPTPSQRTDGVNPILLASSPGIWADSRVGVTIGDSSDGDANRFRIVVFYTSPSNGVQTMVESFDRLSIAPADENYVVDVLHRSRFINWNPTFAPPAAVPPRDIGGTNLTELQLSGAAVNLTGGAGGGGVLAGTDYPALLNQLAGVDDAALLVAASDQMIDGTLLDNNFVDFTNNFITYANNRPQLDLFFVGDLPRLTNSADPVGQVLAHINGTGGATAPLATTFNSLFWPYIRVGDPIGAGANPTLLLPPSGYVAGLFNQTDGRRGVWKAPAGTDVVIGNIVGLDFNILDNHQDDLNPRGVNALRNIPSAGPVIWGSRTRRPDTEYRYIPVRRTAMFLRKSIYRGIQWAVFEPNDDPLWQSLRNTIGAFMETQFRNGAFAGRTSREAYFVKCDAETTTPIDQAAGVVNILVGFAPLRPAEFVVVRLSQKTAQQN